MNNLISYLFKTKAIKVCPENRPFWYTSGKIGPYFINAEFLYGGEEASKELITFINENMGDKINFPKKTSEITYKNYQENAIYKEVIDTMKDLIEKNINVNEIDYVSGGERRDWFFSYVIAKLLNKPHITIYKDLSVVVSDLRSKESNKVSNIRNAKVLHVADLLNASSSYKRAWIPAIQNINGKILWSIVAVDRLQGGEEYLESENIRSFSIIDIDKTLFDRALELKYMSGEQRDMVVNFIEEPDKTMEDFLRVHPEFMEESLNSSDEKIRERARLCIESGAYNI